MRFCFHRGLGDKRGLSCGEIIWRKRNMDNDNNESVTNLGLSPGYSEPCVKRQSSHDSGAGANAGSRVDMTFVASSSLSELVWSHHKGLSLKCAESSLAQTKPSVLWAMGPTDTSEAAKQVKSEVGEVGSLDVFSQKDVDVVHACGPSLQLNAGTGGYVEGVKTTVEVSAIHINKDDYPRDDKVKDSCSPLDFRSLEHGKGGDGSLFKINERKNFEDISSSLKSLGVKEAMCSETKRKQCEARGDTDNMKKTDSIISPRLERLESTAENEIKTVSLHNELTLPCQKPASPSSRGIRPGKRKDKEKALSDGDIKGKTGKDEDDSHESVESCSSTMLISKGKKRCSFEQQLVSGSKKVKKQIQENPFSTSFHGKQSSFMNWISNMMKGSCRSSNWDETPPSLSLTLHANSSHANENADQKLITSKRNANYRCKSTGFDTIFQSLYLPNKSFTKYQTGEGSKFFHGEESNCEEQFLLAEGEEPKNEVSFPKPCSRKRKSNSVENDIFEPPKTTLSHKPVRSLWISRFSPQSSGRAVDPTASDSTRHPKSSDSKKRAEDGCKELQNCYDTEVCFGLEKVEGNKSNMIRPSQRFNNSEAMASTFARRLGSLKNIVPSNLMDSEDLAIMTCFFCGLKGHDLRDCSEITDNELEDLIRNINSSDKVEESSCLCVICFQLNHWAIACPRRMKMDANSKAEVSNVFSCKKYTAANSLEKGVKEHQLTPFCNFVDRQISHIPEGIFEAIKRVRLSRADIIKWMSSRISLSHLDGFFLRLRLGKWDEGTGGTGYYVACITGVHVEKSPKSSQTPISVNVGGRSCLVESQYVSNHEFHEDELMAWWRATSRCGGKIPSEEDLKVKFEERKNLGF